MHTHCTSLNHSNTRHTPYFTANSGTRYLFESENMHACHICTEPLKHADASHVAVHCKHTGTRYLFESENMHACHICTDFDCFFKTVHFILLRNYLFENREIPIPSAGMGTLSLVSGTPSYPMQFATSWTRPALAHSAEDSPGSLHADLSLPLWWRGGGTPPIHFIFLRRGT